VFRLSEKKLSKEVMGMVTRALSEYFGDELTLTEHTHDGDGEWLYRVKTDWLYKNRGVFGRVMARYYISADVIQHRFDDDENKYRNGKVFRIHPNMSWEHYGGGTNGHETEDRYIIIEKSLSHWNISKELR
jgi:hypothetical protein